MLPLSRAAKRAQNPRNRDRIVLRGGPMDGWVVELKAPCLDPEWASTWPARLARRQAPGRYVVSGSIAEWAEAPG